MLYYVNTKIPKTLFRQVREPKLPQLQRAQEIYPISPTTCVMLEMTFRTARYLFRFFTQNNNNISLYFYWDQYNFNFRSPQLLELLTSLLSNNQKVSSTAGKLAANGYVIFKTIKGMYCRLCQTFDKRPFGRDKWNREPSVRFRLQSVKEHKQTVAHKEWKPNVRRLQT